MTDLKTPLTRFLFVNKLSASRTISQFVKRLWSPQSALPVTGPPEAPQVTVAAELPSEEPRCPADTVLAGPPRFEMRAFWMPKRGNSEAEWEDGYAENSPAGLFALADGAGDGIFTKLWVELLLNSFNANPIALDDLSLAEPWIQERRREWFKAIRYPEQRWSIQRKVDQSCAAATFFAFRLDPPPIASGNTQSSRMSWTAWVVGDICLFHVRDGRLIASFPMKASADFNLTPLLYQSKALRPLPVAAVFRGELRAADLIILATDATAQRLLLEVESDNAPDWERYWQIDQEQWRQEIEALRDRNAIVNDDCTLVVLRLTVPSHERMLEGDHRPLPADEPLTSPTSADAEIPACSLDAVTGAETIGNERATKPEPVSASSDDGPQRDETNFKDTPIATSHYAGEQP